VAIGGAAAATWVAQGERRERDEREREGARERKIKGEGWLARNQPELKTGEGVRAAKRTKRERIRLPR
jgi:hypothetical protein